jgi:diguanylate cyclase (GGDEF)-like protein
MRGPLLVLLETDDFARELHTDYLVARGFRVRAEALVDDALAALKKGAPVLISGIHAGGPTVAELYADVRKVSASAALLVILSRSAADGPQRALREGALEAMIAPVSGDALALGVVRCLETVALLARSPEMRRHVELYHAALRLQRAPDAPAIGRELLAAAFARVPCEGGVLVAGPVPTGGFDLVAVREVPEDALRDLLAAWDPNALAGGVPLADGVLSFPSGGPFARARGKAARLAAQTLAISLAPVGGAALTAALFLAKPKKDRPEDRDLGRDLATLRGAAVFALEAVQKYPEGGTEWIDPATNLFDERFLLRALDHEIQRKTRTGGGDAALMVLHLSGLVEAGQTHGAVAQSRLFAEASRLLLRSVRELDVVARTAPDEFSVLLLGTDLAGAQHTADRVAALIAAHRFLAREGIELHLDVTAGVAVHPDHGADAAALRLAAAEAARPR